jgi:hypothetical protein
MAIAISISMAISKFNGNDNQNVFFEIAIAFYLSVTHPVDALETDLAYFNKTPFVAFKAG